VSIPSSDNGLVGFNSVLAAHLLSVDAGHGVQVSAELVERFGELYALRVIGTGMIDCLIDDGDLVLIKTANCAKNGEVGVAWFVKEETSILRKFYSEGDYVRLQPGNSKLDPIYGLKENVQVRGIVVCVIRVSR
jgi:repressor LexA